MNQPRILLLGKTGQVGWELQRTLTPLGPVAALDYPQVDLADAAALRELVLEVRPRIIVNAAAYTAVDRAETEPERAMAINGHAPGVLAETANTLGALLVHYSTDYVYDGTKDAPYEETDAPNPLNAYGRSKLAGERAIETQGGRYLIFRVCWVYSARGQNFLRTIQRLARERDTLRVVADQRGCPTWARLIAEATALALQRWLDAPNPAMLSGLYHLAAGGVATWHQFASRIVECMPAAERRCQTVVPIPTAEYPTPARRPANSVLACEKLRRVFGMALPSWEHGLQLALDCDSS